MRRRSLLRIVRWSRVGLVSDKKGSKMCWVTKIGNTVVMAAFLVAGTERGRCEPTEAAQKGFDQYTAQVEARLKKQHGSAQGFLVPADWARVKSGELVNERVNTAATPDLPGALLYHWRGTAFVPGTAAADFEQLMRNFDAYPKVYAPQVLRAKVEEHDGNHYVVQMRVEQKHVITVVLDTAYGVSFEPGSSGAGARGYSISRSMHIDEIESPGTANEKVLDANHEHGFLWRLNTYWSWDERDGGLYMQIETVSLTRSVPAGLGWAIGPFVESIPRQSLEFTLNATAAALRR
jgi:hypothetical protein